MRITINFLDDKTESGARMKLTKKQFEDLLNKKLPKKESDELFEMYMLAKITQRTEPSLSELSKEIDDMLFQMEKREKNGVEIDEAYLKEYSRLKDMLRKRLKDD